MLMRVAFSLDSVLVLSLCVFIVLESARAVPTEVKSRSKRYLKGYCNCQCGVVNRQQRVVGGNITKVNEFPWIAGISHGGTYHCGAALITRRHLLTAAHCINGFDFNELTVTLGDHDRLDLDRHYSIEVRGLRSVRKHEHFDKASFNNDIAILEMDSPVDFNHRIQPVCLPNDEFLDYAGRIGIIAGWGKTKEKGEISTVLRKVAVPVWSRRDCYNSGYGERKISENMFCAGYPEGGIDACQGDSGGPLQLSNSFGDMEIIGVVSWGRGCARKNLPGVYTKVVNYLHWVEESIEDECLCRNAARRF
ncbi:trypsin-1-like [Cylas formicarius]|uniref:trypsin-1-like n=1 Tax=Cylas formicarius TaxID=197179 RepID=UPI0029585548|nr:trypsin-1-like [Cylas formicarius]